MALDNYSDDDLAREVEARKTRHRGGATIPDDAIVMTGKWAEAFGRFVGFVKDDGPADDGPADDAGTDDDGPADDGARKRGGLFGEIR
jgi:hypothetical protein